MGGPLLGPRAIQVFKILTRVSARSEGDCPAADVSNGRLTVSVDVEDETVKSEDTDSDEVELDHLGSNGR